MMSVPLRWKLRELLDQEGVTAYRLIKESGVGATTIYRITNNRSEGVQGRVLDEILSTLHRLTGKRFDVGDVLEWNPADE